MPGLSVPDYLDTLKPYPPGKPVQELRREQGLDSIVKVASNESSFGPSPKAIEAAMSSLKELHRYPDGSAYYLRRRLATLLDQPAERFVFGCGTNEIIDLICRVYVGRGGRAVLPHPSFLIYQKFLQAAGAGFELVPLDDLALDLEAMAAKTAKGADLVVICNPNNPSGSAVAKADIVDFIRELPQETICLIDEAYIDFARDEAVGPAVDLIDDHPNVIVSRTFSKAYGLAALRIGFGIMQPQVADYLDRVRQPFNVTAPALAAAEAAVADQDYLRSVIDKTWQGVDALLQGLRELGLEPYPTQTNFILLESPFPAQDVYRAMLAQGVIIRAMDAFGLGDHLRISVGTEPENELVLDKLGKVLKGMRERS